jgi:hypothetical protein
MRQFRLGISEWIVVLSCIGIVATLVLALLVAIGILE